MESRKNLYLVLTFTLLSYIVQVPATFGQNKTIARQFAHVVITGDNFPSFDGAPINELFVYVYNAAEDRWEQIPFQFDERDAAGSYFDPDEMSDVLDANDELSFLPKDSGDQNSTSWIADVISTTFFRYEIEVTDPLTGEKGWVYLYRSNTLILDANLTDYITYMTSATESMGTALETENAVEELIQTPYYNIAFDGAFAKDWSVSVLGGGDGSDFLDVTKFRANTSFANVSETNITANSVEVIEGLIRAIRRVLGTLTIPIPILPDIVIAFNLPPAFYYPYSSSLSVAVGSLPIAVSSARFSFDLHCNLVNTPMTFFNPKNLQGLVLNGLQDSPVLTIADLLPDNFWVLIAGPQGAVLNKFILDTSISGGQELYFKDDMENDDDTTDNKTIGDIGVFLSNGVQTPFAISLESRFLNSNTSVAAAQQLVDDSNNPLMTATVAQEFSVVVPVELVSFVASSQQNKVTLEWVTASETNNFGFEIERRIANEDWSKIGFVPGHGTTTETQHYKFTDFDLLAGEYHYRLKQIDTDGSFEFSPTITAVIGSPETFVLHQNFPNPFNPSTQIQFEIPGTSVGSEVKRTTLQVYNLLGNHVRTLFDQIASPGFYSVSWDGKDKDGRYVPSAVYIYQLSFDGFVATKKMILVK